MVLPRGNLPNVEFTLEKRRYSTQKKEMKRNILKMPIKNFYVLFKFGFRLWKCQGVATL